jgi:hypothetical protein
MRIGTLQKDSEEVMRIGEAVSEDKMDFIGVSKDLSGVNHFEGRRTVEVRYEGQGGFKMARNI